MLAPPPSQVRLQRLRTWRAPARDLSMRAPLVAAIEAIQRRRSALDGVLDVWHGIVPAEISANTIVESWRAGVLTVRATDSSARFALDRFLRLGGQSALASRSRRSLHRVRIVIAESPD